MCNQAFIIEGDAQMFGKNCKIYKSWIDEWRKFDNIPYQLDIANIGSSAAANNIDYDLWDEYGYNLAAAPRDMYYDNQVLEQYIDHIKSGGIMLIALMAEDLIVDSYGDEYHNLKYYGYLEPKRIINYSNKTDKYLKRYPGLVEKRFLKMEIKEYIKKVIHWDKIKGKGDKLDLEEHAIAMKNSWYREFGWEEKTEITEEQKKALERSWVILKKDFSCCQKKNILPVVVVLPFSFRLKRLIPKEIIDECLFKYINKAEKEGINVINFWNDDELFQDSCYESSILLNEKGKKIFNRKLRTKIGCFRGNINE